MQTKLAPQRIWKFVDLPREFEIKLVLGPRHPMAVAIRKGATEPCKVFKGGRWENI